MENKEFTDLANSWVERRSRIESSDVFNRRLLSETLVSKTFWLAPKPVFFYVFFAAMFIFATLYCILARPGYWPVAALCLFGGADMAWQNSMRDKIRGTKGGVIVLQTNLLRYRRGYIWLSVAMFVIMIPFFWWFGWFFDMYSDPVGAAIFLSSLALCCIVVYTVRTRKTFRALGDLQQLSSELKDICKD